MRITSASNSGLNMNYIQPLQNTYTTWFNSRMPYFPASERNDVFFFLIKPTDALISQIYFVMKLYMFRAVPLPIIRSFPLYVRHWYMSSNLHDIHQCRMYSVKRLMMGTGTARNM